MKFGFKNWRQCSQDIVPLDVDKSRMYYVQAQAWHLKGYLGGAHSWLTLWSEENQSWIVIELSDEETMSYQDGKVLYSENSTSHTPFMSTRSYNAQWFGHNPYIVDNCIANVPINRIVEAMKEYPIKEFNILNRNCNTFTSYMIWKLNLRLRRPFKSIGFKNVMWWQKNYGTKVSVY
jgi:hypothetical protein